MKNNFEKIYQIDPSRENFPRIEMSDEEYINLINLQSSNPPPIPMKLEMPLLEEAIRKGKKDEESESKSTKRRHKKISTKPYKPAVARVQKKLP